MTWRDAMRCSACGQEERASEGAPCVTCSAFICQLCTIRGVVECARCTAVAGGAAPEGPGPRGPSGDRTADS